MTTPYNERERTRRVLDLSTAHITAEDGQLLVVLHHGGAEAFRERTDQSPLPCYGAHEYGGVFWVESEYLREHEEYAWSPMLLAVLGYAAGEGFDFVLFDADARLHPDLPTCEW